MYKFVTIQGACGQPYNVQQCEQTANQMAAQGMELTVVYQTSISNCGQTTSALVMVFKQRQ